ncbi:MAG: hypothetical protein IJT36_05350 [Alphaproteobacteria bacterium]|nr:hypothetical protein [Alphaproteobacteria bacterium]
MNIYEVCSVTLNIKYFGEAMFFKNFFRKDKEDKKNGWSVGATMMEYALVMSLIGAFLMIGYRNVGRGYTRIYNNITKSLP